MGPPPTHFTVGGVVVLSHPPYTLLRWAPLLSLPLPLALPTAGGACRFQSIISSCGRQWVLFNAAQVLPCYVIQVCEDASKMGRYNAMPPPLSGLADDSQEQQGEDRKARLAARVRGMGGTEKILHDHTLFCVAAPFNTSGIIGWPLDQRTNSGQNCLRLLDTHYCAEHAPLHVSL